MNLLVHKIHEQVNLVYQSSKFWWALRPINPCLLVCAPTFSYEIRKKCKLQQSRYNMKVYALDCDVCVCVCVWFFALFVVVKACFPIYLPAFFYKKCMLQPTPCVCVCVCVFMVKNSLHIKSEEIITCNTLHQCCVLFGSIAK